MAQHAWFSVTDTQVDTFQNANTMIFTLWNIFTLSTVTSVLIHGAYQENLSIYFSSAIKWVDAKH